MEHHGDDVCGGVVLMLDRILVLFLLLKIYGAVFFCSRPNPYSGKAVNSYGHS
jgi:hypothetical protein